MLNRFTADVRHIYLAIGATDFRKQISSLVSMIQLVNQLPIAYNIACYEQKAVIVLLALLYLGVKNIHPGPTLPGFLSPNVAKVLVENFGIAGIGTEMISGYLWHNARFIIYYN